MHNFFSILAFRSADDICSSLCVFLGFVVFLGLLLAVLKWGPSWRKPSIISADSPRLWASSPLFAEKRRRAAAAAFALHLHHASPDTRS